MLKKIEKTNRFDKRYGKLKVAIVTSLYHEDLTKSMENACVETLIAAGVKKTKIECFYAAGSWEIAVIVQALASTKKYDGIATFGVIIKGDTYHFDMIANATAQALMNISLEHRIPVALEVLAVNNLEQAKERASGETNKGIEAANALLSTAVTIKTIKRNPA